MNESSVPAKAGSRILVVDSWPVMEWLKGRQPGADRFLAILESAKSGDVRLIICDINLGEIYYNCWRDWGEARAEEVLVLLRSHPIQVIHPSEEDVLTAARLKGQHPISYADTFAAGLAIAYRAKVLTGDPDFKMLARIGLIELEWLGA